MHQQAPFAHLQSVSQIQLLLTTSPATMLVQTPPYSLPSIIISLLGLPEPFNWAPCFCPRPPQGWSDSLKLNFNQSTPLLHCPPTARHCPVRSSLLSMATHKSMWSGPWLLFLCFSHHASSVALNHPNIPGSLRNSLPRPGSCSSLTLECSLG